MDQLLKKVSMRISWMSELGRSDPSHGVEPHQTTSDAQRDIRHFYLYEAFDYFPKLPKRQNLGLVLSESCSKPDSI